MFSIDTVQKNVFKRDDFNFPMLNFQFRRSNIPFCPSNVWYRFARACLLHEGFININILLTQTLQHFWYEKAQLQSTIHKCYCHHRKIDWLAEAMCLCVNYLDTCVRFLISSDIRVDIWCMSYSLLPWVDWMWNCVKSGARIAYLPKETGVYFIYEYVKIEILFFNINFPPHKFYFKCLFSNRYFNN